MKILGSEILKKPVLTPNTRRLTYLPTLAYVSNLVN